MTDIKHYRKCKAGPLVNEYKSRTLSLYGLEDHRYIEARRGCGKNKLLTKNKQLKGTIAH